MSRLSRIFKCQHFIVDNDKKVIHKVSKITIDCEIGSNTEYLTDLQAHNYEIYDYYTLCTHCCEHTILNKMNMCILK